MKVFKFGGASVKNAAAIKNVAAIVRQQEANQLLIVVSAMGKTTNALERVVSLAQAEQSFDAPLQEIKDYHHQVIEQLGIQTPAFLAHISTQFENLKAAARSTGAYDFVYDQVVAQGELLSSLVLSEYMIRQGISATWMDARNYIQTDSTWREGKVNWEQTRSKVQGLKKFYKANLS